MHDANGDRCTVLEVQVFLFSIIACESETILPLFLSYSRCLRSCSNKLNGLSTVNAGLLHDLTLVVSHDNYYSCRTAFKI